jgi:membrane-bound serine protease (ClpP class)
MSNYMVRRVIPVLGFLLLWAGLAAAPRDPVTTGTVAVLSFEGVINPIAANYITRGIEQAEDMNAECAILELDTPGGLDASMRTIVRRMMNAAIPIVVYVAPRGARAASAGVFITLAADFAAMAPGTNIGAAHPVDLAGKEISEKIVNDAAAYIKSIAEARNRNVEWAEKAVRESVSITEREAMEQGVIDIVAESMPDLLRQLNGKVAMMRGRPKTLHTLDAPVVRISMHWREKFFHALADPNIAYVFFLLGVYGLIYEVTHVGAILPGVAGAIFIILALMAFASLPVNLAGIFLIILGMVFFVLELKTPSYGALGLGGIIAFTLGSIILFSPSPFYAVAKSLILGFAIVTAAFFLLVIRLVWKAHRGRIVSGIERLQDAEGVVKLPLDPTGIVLVDGEEWNAYTDSGPIRPGERIRVLEVKGLTLRVEKKTG